MKQWKQKGTNKFNRITQSSLNVVLHLQNLHLQKLFSISQDIFLQVSTKISIEFCH